MQTPMAMQVGHGGTSVETVETHKKNWNWEIVRVLEKYEK
jgi:hypothetical protein